MSTPTPTPARVPVEPGYFTIPETPGGALQLLGSRCHDCSEVFFPRRHVCACCFSQQLDDCELGPRGTLYTWTYVHVPMFGALRAEAGGYAVGQVDLPEGPRVQAVLEGGPDDFWIGMDLELDLETLRVDSEQREVVIFRFRPVRGPQGGVRGPEGGGT